MIYLLDVNALVALGFLNHEFHARIASWVQSSNAPQLGSCSIAEQGTGDQEAALSAIGLTELIHGIYRAQTPGDTLAPRIAFK
jgi:hypothetical protein